MSMDILAAIKDVVRRLGRAAAAAAREKFDVRTMASRYEEPYRQLL